MTWVARRPRRLLRSRSRSFSAATIAPLRAIASSGRGGLQQGDAVARQNLLDLGPVAVDPLIERVLPLLVGEAHAHGHLIVEADLRIRLERHDGPALGSLVLVGQKACNR